MSIYDKYEPVIGLEIHAQLLTESKAFSADSAAYGGSPNSHVSVISMGHPGTLPRMNRKVIDFAIKLGLACHCDINRENQFSRKNYFYADLPKGYQITQFDTPICTNGHIILHLEGEEKRVGITRIHMEEDSGKSVHDLDPYHTLVDLNRAGVPLLEMVSEPDMRTAEEAYQYVTEVRKLVRYLEICDGNMEEGSLRCDANISVRPKGQEEFGEKVEIKNMNSIRNVKRAIEFEIKRQIDKIEAGGVITQHTMGFDAVKGETFPMRTKEMAHDYRYFPEPDLPPVILTDDDLKKVQENMPTLPEELLKRLKEEMGLSEYDAQVIVETKEDAAYFEELVQHTDNYKAAANWLMGPVKSYLNEHAVTAYPIPPDQLAALINLVDAGTISNSAAKQKVLPALIQDPKRQPEDIATEMNLVQNSDVGSIQDLIDQAIAKFPDKATAYREGQKGLAGLFMGEIMRMSNGSVDPQVANKLLIESLNKS
jgi:aspartyl-tRNA(Asn)/glutamyl-tRNA(Gln) amidotransferase subunit B